MLSFTVIRSNTSGTVVSSARARRISVPKFRSASPRSIAPMHLHDNPDFSESWCTFNPVCSRSSCRQFPSAFKKGVPVVMQPSIDEYKTKCQRGNPVIFKNITSTADRVPLLFECLHQALQSTKIIQFLKRFHIERVQNLLQQFRTGSLLCHFQSPHILSGRLHQS